jgi:hypothetical protein
MRLETDGGYFQAEEKLKEDGDIPTRGMVATTLSKMMV